MIEPYNYYEKNYNTNSIKQINNRLNSLKNKINSLENTAINNTYNNNNNNKRLSLFGFFFPTDLNIIDIIILIYLMILTGLLIIFILTRSRS